MKMKRIAMLLLAVILMFTLAACGGNTNTPSESENNGNTENNNNNVVEETSEEEETDELTTIKLYFVNQKYIETGDESLDRIIEVEREVEAEEKSVEEVIVEELKNKPEDESLTTLLERIEVLGVETKDNIAYVDLSSENLAGGSLEESLVLSQIVYSLTEVDEIESVQILVDGSERETLMGHITIEEPLKREDVE